MCVNIDEVHIFRTDVSKALLLSAAAVVGSGFTLVIQPWMTYLLFLAISVFAILINIFGYRILGRWNEGAREMCHTTIRRKDIVTDRS